MKVPIGWKIALGAAALAGVVLVIFASGTFLHLFHEQLEEVDLTLEAERHHISALQESQLSERTIEELLRFQPWLRIAMFDGQDRLIRRSEQLPEEIAREQAKAASIHTVHHPGGESWRVTALRTGQTTVVLAHTLSEVNEIMRDLLFGYAVLFPVVLIVSALGGWWAATRALAPLRALTVAAENIRADHLDRRVPVYPANDEIRRLTEVLNAMLARLEQSFRQAQRFAADASHELRTPLTIMHGEIERLVRTPGIDPGHEEKQLSLQEEIGRLDRITEHLLLLARFDAGQVALARERVDLSALVQTACEDAEMLADARDVELSTSIAADVCVGGDQAHLRRLVLTLLDNATLYNTAGGKVHCALDRKNGRVELRVRNTGPGIPAAMRPRVFQRFFRVDPARGRGGHGLGLSLSREIAHAHGGEIELGAGAEDGWTEFVVTLPAAVGRA